MPDRITIQDPADVSKTYMVSVGYRGKTYYCPRCQERHLGKCPYKQDFYAEKALKSTQPITTKILSDSTLRHADDTGLRADIICMSGGRIGNVAHMLKDAPNIADMEHVIVVAGTNDLLRDSESEEEFSTAVARGVEMLQDQLYGRKTTLTFAAPPLPPDLHPLQATKAARFHSALLELSQKADMEFQYIPTKPGIPMDGIHPTVAGTDQFLRHIDEATHFIRNPLFITNDRSYSGVESVYKYGCRKCMQFLGLNDHFVCPTCSIPVDPAPDKGEAVLTITNNFALPDASFKNDPQDTDMSDADRKRCLTDSTTETQSKLQRHHRVPN